MRIIDLQRRLPGELLDRLHGSVAKDRRGRWNESGHARIDPGRERDDAREHVAAHVDMLGDDWTEQIVIL
jgi:hypothetical protein